MTELAVSWPPTHEQRAHLEQLAALIKQFGADRFTTAPIVRADERDFPDTWEPTIAGVQRLMYRLCWHAHWDPEVVVEDVRAARPDDQKMLAASEIELAAATNGVVTIAVARIGNDDIAGLLGHRVGQAFLELAPGDPFRGSGTDITETAGSVAAIYLGLGVMVANSSMYRRYASKIVARMVVEEQYVAEVGGLSIGEATFLLAVQDIVRDDASDAFETLHKPQREWLERWRDALDPHEDELRHMLGLDDAPDVPLGRRTVPRTVTAGPERDLRRFNVGRTTFRVKDRHYWPMVVGVGTGLFGFLAPHPAIVGPTLIVALAAAGRMVMRDYYVCADTQCGRHMATLIDECPGCGGTIRGTIKHANDRLDALEELERQDKENA